MVVDLLLKCCNFSSISEGGINFEKLISAKSFTKQIYIFCTTDIQTWPYKWYIVTKICISRSAPVKQDHLPILRQYSLNI